MLPGPNFLTILLSFRAENLSHPFSYEKCNTRRPFDCARRRAIIGSGFDCVESPIENAAIYFRSRDGERRLQKCNNKGQWICAFSRVNELTPPPPQQSAHTMIWSVSGDIVNSEFLSTRRLKLLAPHSNEMPRVKTRVKESPNASQVVRTPS